VNVELLLTPNCPNASAARAVLADCLRRLGLTVRVQERVGDHPSPTILVDGVDVMTRADGAPWLPACRLDVPTRDRVMAALRGGSPPRSSKDSAHDHRHRAAPDGQVGLTVRRSSI
jgi:hypothetical protein